jgi:alkaline phosphatase D
MTPPRALALRLALAAMAAALLRMGPASANGRYLQSGPMVGYSEPKEVLLWVQTNAPARVKFTYWDETNPADRHQTAEKATLKQEAFIAKLVADEVEPGRRYAYELLINDERVERPYPLRFQAKPVMRFFRGPGAPAATPPSAPGLRIAAGSCFYANDPADAQGWNPGAEYPIFEAIREKKPDLMLWLGDNLYTRDIDWTSRTGMIQRYTYSRAIQELQPLLGSVHHYAIWDDHDYGPNDSDRSYRDKEISKGVFQLFWGNPSYGVEQSRGITSRFTWADAEFFLLDNRWNRSPNMRRGGKREILGEAQLEWLLDSLTSSNATFKFVVVGGQVLNPARVAETYANYPEEQQELVRRIGAEGVRGVFFLTGDRHFTDLSKLERPGTYPLYDFTVSPLTVSPSNGEREPNTLRVPGSYVQERNFATLDVGGPFGNRQLTLTVWSSRGEQKWSRVIAQRELRDPDE